MRRWRGRAWSKSWVHWATTLALPLLFFLFTRLLAIRGIPETIKPPILKHSVSDIAAGVFLGLFEDLLVVALLVSAIVTVDWASRRLLHRAQLWVGERYRTRTVLRWTHHFLQFAIVLALVAAALAPCAYDMILVRTYHTRLSTERSTSSHVSNDVDTAPSVVIITFISTAVFCVAASLVFVCAIDLRRCLPTCAGSRPLKENETAYLTPTYLHLGFSGYKSPSLDLDQDHECSPCEEVDSGEEAGERHVIVVSAPSCTSDDVNENESSHLPSPDHVIIPTHPQPQLSSRVRRLLGVSVLVGAFALVAVVVCAISKDTSPLVAAVAMNATLNELFRLLLGEQFMPTDTITVQGVDPTHVAYSRRRRV